MQSHQNHQKNQNFQNHFIYQNQNITILPYLLDSSELPDLLDAIYQNHKIQQTLTKITRLIKSTRISRTQANIDRSQSILKPFIPLHSCLMARGGYQKGELYLMEISWETISKPSSCYCEEGVVPGDGVSLN